MGVSRKYTTHIIYIIYIMYEHIVRPGRSDDKGLSLLDTNLYN